MMDAEKCWKTNAIYFFVLVRFVWMDHTMNWVLVVAVLLLIYLLWTFDDMTYHFGRDFLFVQWHFCVHSPNEIHVRWDLCDRNRQFRVIARWPAAQHRFVVSVFLTLDEMMVCQMWSVYRDALILNGSMAMDTMPNAILIRLNVNLQKDNYW